MSCFFWVKIMLKTAWERLLVSFMLVAATVLQKNKKKKKHDDQHHLWCFYFSRQLYMPPFRIESHISTKSLNWATWLCFQSPSDPGCRCRKWRRAWTDLQHKVPSEGAPWHAGSLCSWDSAGHAHAHSRSPCNSPFQRHGLNMFMSYSDRNSIWEKLALDSPTLMIDTHLHWVRHVVVIVAFIDFGEKVLTKLFGKKHMIMTFSHLSNSNFWNILSYMAHLLKLVCWEH